MSCRRASCSREGAFASRCALEDIRKADSIALLDAFGKIIASIPLVVSEIPIHPHGVGKIIDARWGAEIGARFILPIASNAAPSAPVFA